jgi:peptidoglycan hydrolase CwlO-like protein
MVVVRMNNKLGGLIAFLIILSVLLPSAVAQQSLADVKNTTDETLQNVSQATNQTTKEIQNTLNPIQDILNSIYSIINQIQQIWWMITGGQ